MQLELAHGPAPVHSVARKLAALVVIASKEQRTAVPLAQLLTFDQLERLVGQLEQADQVRDRYAAAADPQAHLFAGQSQLLDERGAAARLLHWIEVLASHVL